MRFVPKKPREGINVSDTHPLVEAGTLMIGLGLLFVFATFVLVFVVEVALYFVSPEAEAEFFEGWAPGDLASLDEDDRRLQETRALVGRIARHWPDSPYEFRLEVDQSEVPNAMAFPGGLVIVTTGLLDRVESENELAFVLGHEIGHFKNRDHLRMLGRGFVFSIFFNVVLASDGSDAFGLTVADLALRGFSREQESEADLVALEMLQAEYGHVDQSWRFFERLIEEERESTWLFVYLSTHPAAEMRIDEIREHAYAEGWPVVGDTTPLSW